MTTSRTTTSNNPKLVSSQESASSNPSSFAGSSELMDLHHAADVRIPPENTAERAGWAISGEPSSETIQQQQQQQQQQLLYPDMLSAAPTLDIMLTETMTSTPWTLGSTDGSYAMQIIMLQQQQQAQVELQPVGGGVEISASGEPEDVPTRRSELITSELNNALPQQQQQQPLEQFPPSSNPQPIRGLIPWPLRTASSANNSNNHHTNDLTAAASIISNQCSLYQDRLFRQPSSCVEIILAAACGVMGFDIAELWLRTGPKTHQLTNSHLRPTALLDDTVGRTELVDVYYGDKSAERTHRLSPALCKRAKEAKDVVWIAAHTPQGAEALRCSISNVRTAVAVPVCHPASNTNLTILFFSIRKILVKPTAVEFLVHMALSAGVASVNSLSEDGLVDRTLASALDENNKGTSPSSRTNNHLQPPHISHSEHLPSTNTPASLMLVPGATPPPTGAHHDGSGIAIRHQRLDRFSVTGAPLDLQWRQLTNVEYLTDGGNSWIHTAVFNGKPVVVKTLKPECQDVAVAINEIEGELAVHSRLNHANICALLGAGTTSKGVRFVVLERLDGGTLTQMLGYDTRIRDRRRRFWRKKQFSSLDIVRIAKSIAEAMMYCHEEAIPSSIVMHRDLKPDNIGFTLDGTVKILDFGLAKIIESASVDSDDVYVMSGETGSLRYMAPEVADGLPYNFCADVYSFGIILWELNAGKKPFDGLNRELFYERVVHGGERPPLHRKWSKELTNLMAECWDADMHSRPKFRDVVARLDCLLDKDKGGPLTKKKQFLPKISGMIDRHSTWF